MNSGQNTNMSGNVSEDIFRLVNMTSTNAGHMSRDDYLFYAQIFTIIKAIGHPISAILLTLSAVVFLRPNLRNSSTGLLVSLNLAEACNVSLLSVYQICKLSGNKCKQSEAYGWYVIYSSTFFGTSMRRCVYIFNCAVSLQRYALIAYPLQSRTWRLIYSPKPIIVGIFAMAILLHGYIPFKYTVERHGGLYVIVLSDVAMHHVELFHIITTFNIIITAYVPVAVGLIANIGMGHALIIHQKARKNLNCFTTDKQFIATPNPGVKKNVSHNHYKTTVVIFVSTLVFFVFSLPSTLNQILKDETGDYGPNGNDKYLYCTLDQGFVVFQIVSDLVIVSSYMGIGKHYRREFKKLIGLEEVEKKLTMHVSVVKPTFSFAHWTFTEKNSKGSKDSSNSKSPSSESDDINIELMKFNFVSRSTKADYRSCKSHQSHQSQV